MASAAEKAIVHQNQQQQPVLKCPRCSSSNTKFCYFNNYSLSQPRHFCKACKRYWTRGGTLRNVPVGGGCRKNKRSIKKTMATTSVTVGHNPNPNLDSSTTSSNSNFNPLYGLLPQNSKYPRFEARVSHTQNMDGSRYNLLHPHMISSFGLEFSSSDPASAATVVANHGQDSISSYPSMISSSATFSNPTMASFIASSLQQQPRYLGFAPQGDGGGSVLNDVQMAKSRMDWNNNFNVENHNHPIKAVESSDPTSFLWNTAGGDGEEWLDPTNNICSSVPSLI